MKNIIANPRAGLGQFDSMPVGIAVAKNVVPAIVSMLMVLVYNLADTFFIGLTGDDLLVASVSLAHHVYMLFLTFGTLFGIGGTSVISRAFGAGRNRYAKRVSSFCMWSSVAIGIIIPVLSHIFMDDLLTILGASADTWKPTKDYLSIILLGGPFLMMASCFSGILRSEGQATRAMMGMLLGNIVNVILDPILILWMGWGIKGAAIATVISNIAGAIYFLTYFLRVNSRLSINPRHYTIGKKVAISVFAIGIPSAIGPLFMSLSQITMNRLMAGIDDFAIAAAGVAARSIMIIFVVSIGFSQGIMPLLGYCVGAENWKRYKEILKFSIISSTAICTALTAVCYIANDQIIGIFLTEKISYEYGIRFAKIFLSTAFLSGAFFSLISAIQAIGDSIPALILNISRQGIIYIPILFTLHSLFGAYGLIWAQPVSDVLSLTLAISLHAHALQKLIKMKEKAFSNFG
ncbi:MAG: MATE family efflux transporter [Holophagaceae bacterium]|nr:MATE family efflux transporter [Holophagaceae bacterium]